MTAHAIEEEGPYPAFADLMTGLLFVFIILVLVLAQRTQQAGAPTPAKNPAQSADRSAPELNQARAERKAADLRADALTVQLTDTEQQLRGAIDDSRKLKGQLAALAEQNKTIKDQLDRNKTASADPSLPGQPIFSLVEQAGSPRYERGSYEPTQDEYAAIKAAVITNRQAIATIRANTLLVEGYASSEPFRGQASSQAWNLSDVPGANEVVGRQIFECLQTSEGQPDCRPNWSFDFNMDLAFRRARRVQEFLVVWLGIPRWCVSVVSHGRSRSPRLRSLAGPDSSENAVAKVDRDWRTQPRLDLRDERKVEMRAVADPRSLCAPDELAKALNALQ